MEHDINNWPYRWYGLWKEYGKEYEKFPSIKSFINPIENARYHKEKLRNYIEAGHVYATTSSFNFPSPFDKKIKDDSISFRTDGKWLWLDNIIDFIDHNNLAIPIEWYNDILLRQYVMPPVSPHQIEDLKLIKWPE